MDQTGAKEHRVYKVLDTIDFTSDRKRMSVIAQSPEGAVMVICKGADNYVRALLKDFNEPAALLSQTHADTFADAGLRTLFVACRRYSTII